MNKEKFKEEFRNELKFFNLIANRDLQENYTIEQVEDELVKFTSSFYGARLDFDKYAIKKCYFIATYAYQIIKGNITDEYLDELLQDIINEDKIRGL